MQKYDVCMLGMGPVGTVSGLCFAKQGFRVVGIDINTGRLAAFAKGKAPFLEPGVNQLLRECQAAGTFEVTDKAEEAIARSRIIMIAVGTPTPEETGIPDLSQLDAVAQTIGRAIKNSASEPIIVVRSTVPPGTMRQRLSPIIAEACGKTLGNGFHVAANPEFLREGKAIWDFFHAGRVVIGADDADVAEEIQKLYRDVQTEKMHVSLEAAEFAKYVDNTWHAVKVTFANEVARVCQSFGGNPQETADIFLADAHLNLSGYYLRPGFAFGGSCLPKDIRGLVALAEAHAVSVPMISKLLASNEEHINQGVATILKLPPKTVGLLGCAFKEGVDDLRESPALMVASKLLGAGIDVIGHDYAYASGIMLPLPRTTTTLLMAEPDILAKRCDALVLMHNLPAYRELAARYRKPLIDLTTVPVNGE